MSELAIMDYSTGEVFLYTLPQSIESVEDYIVNELKFRLSDIEWMVGNITIHDERKYFNRI